jgi:hypothetical protein
MRIPRAAFRFLLCPAVFAIFIVSTPKARADNPPSSKPASPTAKAAHLILTYANPRFGRVPIGQQSVRPVTITNTGDSIITLLQVIIKGTDFTLSGLDVPLTLGSGESFTFSSIFTPRSRGDVRGSISFVSDISSIAKPTLMLELTGTGTDWGQLTVDPSTLDFGKVVVGSPASQTATLSASGAAVTVSSANISDSEFTLNGLSFPFTIAAGGSQEYTVVFTPQASGAVSATLTFFTDGGSSTAVQSLTGFGAVSQSHSVELSWNASTSQDVIGYNIYRSNTSGGPYNKINPVLDASTVYSDTSVSDGSTYYYVTTAIDSNDQESVNSNEAQAVIPGHSSGMAGIMGGRTSNRRIGHD